MADILAMFDLHMLEHRRWWCWAYSAAGAMMQSFVVIIMDSQNILVLLFRDGFDMLNIIHTSF